MKIAMQTCMQQTWDVINVKMLILPFTRVPGSHVPWTHTIPWTQAHPETSLNRIIQSKMIPIQDQIFWTWTRIGVVCRNIGPLKTTDLRPPPTQIEHFILLVYIFFSYTKWDTNKTQMLQRVFKKQGGLNHKNQVDQNFQTLEEVPKLSYSLDILCLNL